MKVCPDCLYEYYSHVENCAECGAVLISLEEHEERQAERKRCMEAVLEEPVAVRQGEMDWMEELFNVLIDSGIPCRVHVETGCRKGCSGHTCRLMVSRRDAESAHGRIEEYFAELHPEARASQERISQGKCPACGSAVNQRAVECSDCGLTLLIIE